LTYQEIQPEFLQNLYKNKHEALPELREILEQNFIQGSEGRWHIPDPNQDKDLEQIRQKVLLREFQGYLEVKGKLRIFRTEAVSAGFAQSWQTGDFESIKIIADKIPIDILQEDPTLIMYYDNAIARI
ncbi:hypothetical protein ACFL0D_04405, partial [Thermoproteota archaeon]